MLLALTACPAHGSQMPPNDDAPDLIEAKNELKPWLTKVESRIKSSRHFQSASALLKCAPNVDSRITISFSVDKNGSCNNILAVDSTGSKDLLEKGVQLIRDSAPFDEPPNNLPHKDQFGIKAKLSKDETGATNVVCSLGRLTRQRIGKQSLPVQQFRRQGI